MFPNNSKRAVYLHFACKSPDALPSSPNQSDSTASFSDILARVLNIFLEGKKSVACVSTASIARIEQPLPLYKSFPLILQLLEKGREKICSNYVYRSD